MNCAEGDIEFKPADEVLEEAERRMGQKILKVLHLELIPEESAMSQSQRIARHHQSSLLLLL